MAMRVRGLLILLTVLAVPTGRAVAQDYPSRPVTIVLP